MNKELPKAVQQGIDCVMEATNYSEAIFGEQASLIKYGDQRKMTEGAQIAQSHYAPIIEAKDKQLSEKDKRITELQAEKYRQNEKYEELARLYGKTVNDLSAANTSKELLKEKLKKVMGLLKEQITEANMKSIMAVAVFKGLDISSAIGIYFKDYCKENGIDLGGE